MASCEGGPRTEAKFDPGMPPERELSGTRRSQGASSLPVSQRGADLSEQSPHGQVQEDSSSGGGSEREQKRGGMGEREKKSGRGRWSEVVREEKREEEAQKGGGLGVRVVVDFSPQVIWFQIVRSPEWIMRARWCGGAGKAEEREGREREGERHPLEGECIIHSPIYSTFLLNEHPSVSLAFPPVGWHSTVEQAPQNTTVEAWLNTVLIWKQPGH